MLNRRDSELLTQVGAGTPMGELMRRYWIPAARSSLLVADGDPVRLMLLGEKLIAFRDSTGRVGVMDHRCPHRCASLFFGRNEEGGIRCVYHGWKFDVEGRCLEQANVPPRQDFSHKVRARAYATKERNGLVWVYMGDQSNIPELPLIEANLMAEKDCTVRFVQRECSWLQAMEGDMDQTHLAFLHLGHVDAKELASREMSDEARYTHLALSDRAPEMTTADTDWGVMGGARRTAENGSAYWRISQFLMPFWTMPSNRSIADHVVARAWIPMDDTHTMFLHVAPKGTDIVPRRNAAGAEVAGIARGDEFSPDSSDWLGRYRLAKNGANDYGLDRDRQRDGSYTGIEGIHLQDQAITESMGGIVDHTFEHLAPSDALLIAIRKRLVQAARALAKSGAEPPAARDAEAYLGVRGGGLFAEPDADWRAAYAHEMANARSGRGRSTDKSREMGHG